MTRRGDGLSGSQGATGGGSAPPPVQGFYWYGSMGSVQTSRPQEWLA
jgi:hypothetical protein